MSKSNKKLFGLFFAIIILILGAFYSGFLSLNFPGKNSSQQPTMMQPEVEVIVVKAKQEAVQLTQELPGRVNAFRISEIRPRTNGIVEAVKFVEGSFVEEKTQLYQLDSKSQKANLEKAKANLTAVKNKADRYEVLLKIDAVSSQEYDDVLTDLAQAKAELETAKENLEYTKVLAPISGHIGKTNVTKGALVTANQQDPLTTIAQLSPIYVDLTQPSKEAIRFGDQKDIAVTISLDGERFEEIGSLKFTEVFADQNTDSVTLRSKFANKDKKLIPGMFVSATLYLKPFTAITIPQRAATRTPEGNLMIWVVGTGNIATPKIIKAQKSFKDKWIVESGLQGGETIIYEGFMKLMPGAKVKPIIMEESNIEEPILQNQSSTTNEEQQNQESVIIVETREPVKSQVAEQKLLPTQIITEPKEASKQNSQTNINSSTTNNK